jgi:hypothetical protein
MAGKGVQRAALSGQRLDLTQLGGRWQRPPRQAHRSGDRVGDIAGLMKHAELMGGGQISAMRAG